MSASNGRLGVSGPGGPLWSLQYRQADVSLGPATARIRGVTGSLYQAGKEALRVDAPEAEVDYAHTVLVLTKGVRAISLLQPAAFHADRLQWSWKAQSGLEGLGHVQFRRGAVTLAAPRLIADVDLKQAHLLDGAIATLQPGGTPEKL
jgi:hypothetical protein